MPHPVPALAERFERLGGRLGGMGFGLAIGAVANVPAVRRLEIIAEAVIPAVAGL